MFGPMLPLTVDIAILDEHTRLTGLETDAPIIAALGTAACRHHYNSAAIKSDGGPLRTTTSFGRVDSQPKSYNFLCLPQPILRVNYLIDHLAADRHSHIHLVLLNWASRICDEFVGWK